MKTLNKILTLISLITIIGINNIDAQNIIWSEDFTNGIPVGWTTVDNTGNNYDWVLNNQSIDNTTSTPAGWTNTTAITSVSGGNHMLLWGGEYNRLAGQPFTDLDSYFQTAAIPVNNLPSVSVSFQQKFKRCCSPTSSAVSVLTVSTDPTFTTNVQDYDINGNIIVNVESLDPMSVDINISSIAANYTGNIYLRFHILSGTSHYYWMIDDIKVVETVKNEIVTTFGNYDFNGLQYSKIPSNHLSPMNFSLTGENFGAVDQTGTTLTVDINDGNTSVFNASTSDTTLFVSSIDTIKMPAAWIPPTSTLNTPYTVTLSINSDSTDYTPANNSVVLPPFEVTTGIMALDDDTISGSRGGSPGPNSVTEYEVGNQFKPLIDDSLYAIDIVLGSGTPVGTVYEVAIYEAQFIPNTFPNYTEIYRSSLIMASLNDINNLKSIILDDPILLTGGTSYFACIHSYIDLEYAISGTSPPVKPASIGQSIISYPNISSPNANSTFILTETPMIRLNFIEPCNLISSFSDTDNGNRNFSFANNSYGNITAYYWDFGDGQTSTLANPNHTYAIDSLYIPCLTVNDGNGCTNTYCDSILVNTTIIPCNVTSNFNIVDNGSGNYTFNNTSAGDIAASYWNFGDGSISNLTNPNHTFLANGTFIVELISNDSTGLCVDYEIGTLQVTGVQNPLACNASFLMMPDSAGSNNVIIFNTSTGNNLTYLWSFGDGNTSTLAYPSYSYTTAGPFEICLTIGDGTGCTDTYCDSINSGGVVLKTGGFSISVTTPLITSIENNINRNSDLMIYPNPFKNDVTISLNLLEQSQTEIFVMDVVGNKVALISNQVLNAGDNKFNWKAKNIANGVYLLNIKTENSLQVKKLILNR